MFVPSIDFSDEAIDDDIIQGTLYLGVEALTACSFALIYLNPPIAVKTIQNLAQGVELKSHLESEGELSYFRIGLKSELTQSTVFIHITPIQGSFIILANKGTLLPTLFQHEFYSEDHNIQLSCYPSDTEITIGIQSQKS